MIHPIYNIGCNYITDLKDVNDTGETYCNYNNIHFYYKVNNKSKNLLVAFNGAISRSGDINNLVPLPVFRNYYNTKHNTLNISDKLLEDFTDKKIILGWFQSPSNKNYFDIYTEIIKFFMDKYDNIIFHGSSAGGFPSMLFASYFTLKNERKCNIITLLFNSQLYLEKYFYFNDFINLTQLSIDKENCNMECIVKKYGSPMHTYIYVNENDLNHFHKHYMPFKKYITDNNLLEHYTFTSFVGEDAIPPKTHHNVLTPNNKNEKTIISEIFNKYK